MKPVELSVLRLGTNVQRALGSDARLQSRRVSRSSTLRGFVLALAVLVAACDEPSLGPSPGTTAQPATYRVVRVIDGDTVVLSSLGTTRLIGVDTPETVDPRRPVGCFGKEASTFLTQLLVGRDVQVEYDGPTRDRYGRTLAYLYLADGVFVNAEIVRQGYGFAYTRFPFRYLDDFRALEREAREAGRGLWSRC